MEEEASCRASSGSENKDEYIPSLKAHINRLEGTVVNFSSDLRTSYEEKLTQAILIREKNSLIKKLQATTACPSAATSTSSTTASTITTTAAATPPVAHSANLEEIKNAKPDKINKFHGRKSEKVDEWQYLIKKHFLVKGITSEAIKVAITATYF